MTLQQTIDNAVKAYDDYFFEATRGRNDVRREKIISSIKKAVEEAYKDSVGEIGAKLLAKHSSQAVLDAYFDAANEVLESHEINN